ncbi:GNAT family N-acetyltransferase [Winogradskyella flava]|uniref:GNAT family N-acetyltransferase n=1 Tax=Winogradskyella flava TaxID=1884876 RepID=A0A842IVR0_9FLAO|nr:GNAT family protein [Winogradskyella flava]MBC2845427.1 GNAT family N-acetyltransferase [Winogradskyella flava]
MKLNVREIQENDIEKIVNYFVNADAEFLKGMGADKSKLPKRENWIKKLESELKKPYKTKEFYYIIWLLDNQEIGHSNINNIEFGKSATMHLHLWNNAKRRSGLGLDFLRLTIPYYFKNFGLEKLICEPNAKNIAPNKVLKKLEFELIRNYDTTPGWINFHQTVNRYELKKEQLKTLKIAHNTT